MIRLAPADVIEPLTFRKKLDNVELYVDACSLYLHKIVTNLFTDYYGMYLDLMDYPESDDDGALATDGAAMLDEEDIEQGDF